MNEAALAATLLLLVMVSVIAVIVGWMWLWSHLQRYIGVPFAILGASLPVLVLVWFGLYNMFQGL